MLRGVSTIELVRESYKEIAANTIPGTRSFHQYSHVNYVIKCKWSSTDEDVSLVYNVKEGRKITLYQPESFVAFFINGSWEFGFIKLVLQEILEAEIIMFKRDKNQLIFPDPETVQSVTFENILCDIDVTQRKNGSLTVRKTQIDKVTKKFDKYHLAA